ncbi:BppU family phage baseplate upper protein [Lactococcus raffinolactis]|uniref:BppU family phage baseplate upper protein n=1 Tax=Pseudolactococcus raffinolactis TaxID=1366 RepID=A0AAE7CSD3_9LACT|nr:BppU family phage baseplate upper protein [Lactococcus raffinolactis]QIW58340.1 BppU family phage baseplate upper protein [Lactococcus raffinolactis]
MTEYKMTLSTTEPNNYVGLIKLRQGDVDSQSIQATITANGQLFNFDHLAVFFNAVLPNGNVIRDKVTEVDYVNSKLSYIVTDSFLQEVTQVTAWFSFENDEKIIDSTKNFQYSVIGGWKECIPQGNYIYELSEIQREIEEIIGNKDFTKLLLKIDSIKTEYNYINQVKADKTELNKTNEEILKLEATTSTLDNKVSALSSGAPKAVSLVSSMTDKTKNYVYTGTESGYTSGNWYYWSGTAWVSGGVYQSTGIGDHSISRKQLDFLPLSGMTGKNLFDPSTATLGNFIGQADGRVLTGAGYTASDFISVLPSTAYRISGTTEQLAFYDINKAYISGLSFGDKITTTPANAAYVRMSMKTTEINAVQLELGTTITSYEPYTIYFNNESIYSPIPESKLDKSLIKGTASKNLFDKSRATLGSFIGQATGKLSTGAGYTASDFISVLPSTAYRISGTTEQLAFYDINKAYISGLSFGDKITTTPANAAYVRMSMLTSEIDSVQIEKGSIVTSYEAYGYHIDNSSLSDGNIEYIKDRIEGNTPIIVKKDFNGDFSSLVEAVRSIKDSSPTKIYDIYIYDDHDIIAELGGQSFVESLTANSDRVGLRIPGFVNLHGNGMVTLSGKIDKTWNVGYNAIKALSLIEIEVGTNFIENITFEAQNMRYAVHDESNGSRPNTVVNWKNCKFIHHGNADFASDVNGYWVSAAGYGMGTASNNYRFWENCTFDSAAFYAFSCHDNENFAFAANLKFDNCEFYNRQGNPDYPQDIRLSTYLTGSVDNLAIINNSILKDILIKNETTGTENRWKVKGGGNSNRSISEANTSVPKTITI